MRTKLIYVYGVGDGSEGYMRIQLFVQLLDKQ